MASPRNGYGDGLPTNRAQAPVFDSMPYKWERDHIPLPATADRRRRLAAVDRTDIQNRYKAGESVRAIARAYEGVCSRRLVQFVLFPEREALVHKQAKERGQHKKTYERVRGARWAEIMREHRAYKNGVLTEANLNKKQQTPRIDPISK